MTTDSVPSAYRAMWQSATTNARAGVRTFLTNGVQPDLARQVAQQMFRHTILNAGLSQADESMLLTLGNEMIADAVEIETAVDLAVDPHSSRGTP